MWNASRFCVSSLRRGHANLLCIVPILVYVLPKQVQKGQQQFWHGLLGVYQPPTNVPLAQRIARWTSNPKVLGSIPRWDGTTFCWKRVAFLIFCQSADWQPAGSLLVSTGGQQVSLV